MRKLQQILGLEFIPSSVDLGLLVLRLWLGISMLVLHGWGKLSNFQQMSSKFPEFFGLSSKMSLSLAVFGEVVAPILMVIGLFTRLGALAAAVTMGVAFFLAHKAVLKGSNSGELAFIYLAGFVTIFLAGPGKFAIEGKSKGRSDARPAKR